MERQGLGNSEVAVKLRAHLAELTDQIGDAKEEIKALSSDTRGFDLFAGSVSFAADSMQTFAGAAVLAGQSEEDVNESLKSLVAIQSVANGVKGIANELTTRGTAANKVYAFSQQQLAIMMDASATSAQRFKAALITTGFGALIVALGYLVANFDKVKDALSGLTTAQKTAIEVNEKAVDIYTEEKTKVGLLVQEYQNENTSKERKQEIQKKLQEDYPNYFANLKSEKEFADGLTEAYNKWSKALALKAKVQAATSIITENESKALKYQLETTKELIDKFNVDDPKKLPEGKFKDLAVSFVKRRQDEADQIREGNKLLIQTIFD